MRIVIVDSADEVASYGAEIFRRQLASKPGSVLGLATGATPVRLYEKLIALCEQGLVSFSQVTTFNLDEYLGLAGDDTRSYRHFMNSKLFDHVDIDQRRTHIPAGDTGNARKIGVEYEAAIEASGGIDLQLLGIGANGHIGFNEPYSSLASRTRVKTLTAKTIADNARFFSDDEYQPHLAITMGIGTILDSKQVLLLATGSRKAEAVAKMIEGPVAANCPASALQLHQKATAVLDTEAASALDDPEFFRHIEREDRALDEG